ncbi:hypothetical protein BB561_002547 [Smittium simulii]|uniref:YEATS domain-containing protein n=1 Tax=Smittium simulii TaxID=133385 RepID=A0A2T9YQ60_9FUNG|nr:hypothetical protein BB561_002547 [Smittium simulii]
MSQSYTANTTIAIKTTHKPTPNDELDETYGYPLRDWSICLIDGRPECSANPKNLPYVKKVEFQLDQSFKNPVRVIRNPPFFISEKGWGEFDIFIIVYFADKNVKPKKFAHNLCFSRGPVYMEKLNINFGKVSKEFFEILNLNIAHVHPRTSSKAIPRKTVPRINYPKNTSHSDISSNSESDLNYHSSSDHSDGSYKHQVIRNSSHTSKPESTTISYNNKEKYISKPREKISSQILSPKELSEKTSRKKLKAIANNELINAEEKFQKSNGSFESFKKNSSRNAQQRVKSTSKTDSKQSYLENLKSPSPSADIKSTKIVRKDDLNKKNTQIMNTIENKTTNKRKISNTIDSSNKKSLLPNKINPRSSSTSDSNSSEYLKPSIYPKDSSNKLVIAEKSYNSNPEALKPSIYPKDSSNKLVLAEKSYSSNSEALKPSNGHFKQSIPSNLPKRKSTSIISRLKSKAVKESSRRNYPKINSLHSPKINQIQSLSPNQTANDSEISGSGVKQRNINHDSNKVLEKKNIIKSSRNQKLQPVEPDYSVNSYKPNEPELTVSPNSASSQKLIDGNINTKENKRPFGSTGVLINADKINSNSSESKFGNSIPTNISKIKPTKGTGLYMKKSKVIPNPQMLNELPNLESKLEKNKGIEVIKRPINKNVAISESLTSLEKKSPDKHQTNHDIKNNLNIAHPQKRARIRISDKYSNNITNNNTTATRGIISPNSQRLHTHTPESQRSLSYNSQSSSCDTVDKTNQRSYGSSSFESSSSITNSSHNETTPDSSPEYSAKEHSKNERMIASSNSERFISAPFKSGLNKDKELNSKNFIAKNKKNKSNNANYSSGRDSTSERADYNETNIDNLDLKDKSLYKTDKTKTLATTIEKDFINNTSAVIGNLTPKDAAITQKCNINTISPTRISNSDPIISVDVSKPVIREKILEKLTSWILQLNEDEALQIVLVLNKLLIRLSLNNPSILQLLTNSKTKTGPIDVKLVTDQIITQTINSIKEMGYYECNLNLLENNDLLLIQNYLEKHYSYCKPIHLI